MAEFIVYFSRAGENYFSGEIRSIEIGNTEVAAKLLQELTGAPSFKLEPLQPYSNDYNTCVEQARAEARRDARPELKAYPEDMEHCDTIYLCYPNYCGSMPMPVFTFLEHFDFAGKKICPLCTHEGSGMGTSERDIHRLCPQAVLKRGLPIQGSRVKNAKKQIETWVSACRD